MGLLISQFFDAIQNWAEKTDFPEDDLRLYVLDRVGPRVDWRDVEQERQSSSFQRKMKWQDEVERRIMPSPEKIHYREFLLATWREIMAPILALDNQPDMPNLPRAFP